MENTQTQRLALTDFLLARIAEDEATAREAGTRSPSWQPRGTWYLEGVEHDVVGDEEAFCHPHNVAHISRHDPARVLAECEAKRRIVGQWQESVGAARAVTEMDDEHVQRMHIDRTRYFSRMRDLGRIVYTLASVYADHPDFRPEWRP